MTNTIQDLFAHNRAWAAEMIKQRPGFFTNLTQQQTPKYMWIGCSDSRVPANQITGLEPGEVFVHRNIANIVVHTDLNALSTIQFAVDVLHVQDIIVCGHYGCGGVLAALNNTRVGLADNWIRHVKDVAHKHMALIKATAPEWRHNVLCELNAIEQVINRIAQREEAAFVTFDARIRQRQAVRDLRVMFVRVVPHDQPVIIDLALDHLDQIVGHHPHAKSLPVRATAG